MFGHRQNWFCRFAFRLAQLVRSVRSVINIDSTSSIITHASFSLSAIITDLTRKFATFVLRIKNSFEYQFLYVYILL